MAIDFRQLDDFFDGLGREIEEGTERLVRGVALAIDQKAVLATPVDTGRARANWIVTIDEGTKEFNENNFDQSGATAIANGSQVINNFKIETNTKIFLQNNVPYIGKLNQGSSRQAPANFITIAAQQGLQEAVSSIRILRGT